MSIRKDSRYLHGLALTYLADKVEIVTLPKKAKKGLTRYPIQHDANGKAWCGLAAVSALTGETTSVVRDLIRKYRKNPSSRVIGTNEFEIEYVLKKLGYRMDHAYLYGGRAKSAKPTFKQWLEETEGERQADIAYLISFIREGGNDAHWGLIIDDHYICSITLDWFTLDIVPFKRRHIDQVFAIHRK
jgi:hypothetical protein